MSFIYAQIDENNICCAVSNLSGEIFDTHLIPIQTFDTTLIGKKFENNQWVKVPKSEMEETITPESTQLDRIEAAINMKNDEISERAIDTYTKQLLENGLL